MLQYLEHSYGIHANDMGDKLKKNSVARLSSECWEWSLHNNTCILMACGNTENGLICMKMRWIENWLSICLAISYACVLMNVWTLGICQWLERDHSGLNKEKGTLKAFIKNIQAWFSKSKSLEMCFQGTKIQHHGQEKGSIIIVFFFFFPESACSPFNPFHRQAVQCDERLLLSALSWPEPRNRVLREVKWRETWKQHLGLDPPLQLAAQMLLLRLLCLAGGPALGSQASRFTRRDPADAQTVPADQQ